MKNYLMKFTVGKQIAILVSILAVGLLSVGGIGLWLSRHLGDDLSTIVYNVVPVVRSLTMIDMAHDGIRGTVLDATLAFETKDGKRLEATLESLAGYEKSVAEHFGIIESKPHSAEAKGKLDKAKIDMTSYIASATAVVVNAKNQNREGLYQELHNFEVQFEKLEQSLGDTGEFLEKENEEVSSRSIQFAKASVFLLGIPFLLAISLGALSAVVITSIVRGSLSKVVGSLLQGGASVDNSIIEITSASKELSSNTELQASALQETSTAVAEITSMLEKSVDLAKQSAESCTMSREEAMAGQDIVQRMLKSVEAIEQSNGKVTDEISESNRKIEAILNLIQDVGSKTKVINDIVFQTKLLSFNASVEAARAGEHGKGFAVVAEEVGNLAQMSGNSAKEINSIVDRSLAEVKEIVNIIKTSVNSSVASSKESVENGKKIAEECDAALAKIVSATAAAAQMNNNIVGANQESSKGVAEISEAIHRLEKVSIANKDASKSCANVADRLNHEVGEIRSASSVLNSLVSAQPDSGKRTRPFAAGNDSEGKITDESIAA